MVEVSIKEEVVIIGSEGREECFPETELVPGKPRGVVLHFHPSPETAPAEEDGSVFFIEDLRAGDAEEGACWEGGRGGKGGATIGYRHLHGCK